MTANRSENRFGWKKEDSKINFVFHLPVRVIIQSSLIRDPAYQGYELDRLY